MPTSYHSFGDSDSINTADDGNNDLGLAPDDYSDPYAPLSPTTSRQLKSPRTSEVDLRNRRHSRGDTLDERSTLLGHQHGPTRFYTSVPSSLPGTPRPWLSRQQSGAVSVRMPRSATRSGSLSFSQRLVNRLSSQGDYAAEGSLEDSKASAPRYERGWYDQFTSTDWVHDSIADAFRMKELRSRKDIRGRIIAWFDGAQGWILVAIIGCITALIAYAVDVSETVVFDWKTGFCSEGWYLSEKRCCAGASVCGAWKPWSRVVSNPHVSNEVVEYAAFTALVMVLSIISCLLTLTTKTVISSSVSLATLDENLGADIGKENKHDEEDEQDSVNTTSNPEEQQVRYGQRKPPMVFYSAAGSGVAEVKVINSGFVLHGYLGLKTLTIKSLALILSVASGLSLGKEGPFVHIATCVGNIACRLFSKYNQNDGKRREVLSASAASGVAVAFGAPIGGVLFSLEEVSYYFPPKTLFRTFFCCIIAALSLKFLNPYGTEKIVLFEVRYLTDWQPFEMVAFVLVGILGGAMGACFIKASRFWAQSFRRIPIIKKMPVLEVALVALVTGLSCFWNRYTRLPVTELLFELATPCDAYSEDGNSLCPTNERLPQVIRLLAIAFVVKAVLTIITFGIKVPAGIYVPSMVVGGLLGRIAGHIVQYLALNYSHTGLFGVCSPDSAPESCVVPGVYAMVGAGATMCGVTRLSVTLAVILFELTGSLDHVLPFSIGVLVSKWTADALEPRSIYDLLLDMNSYPFLDNKVRPVFTTELGDITPRIREQRLIDISSSPLIPAKVLRSKLDYLHSVGELDGGLAIVRQGILTGLIPGPDLEYALDKLNDEDKSLCLMSTQVRWNGLHDDPDADLDPTDFTPYIDPAPVALDLHSPMDLVYECFVKLGLRYICVLRDGRFAGLVHKKAFTKYIKELEEGEH
ncbi:MAG: hypothetical protein M1821_001551 [Bathelium mastoideum]|nr:MAG: hypothetical protein M1821_001551 [Bathelium mastoideum]